MTTPTAYFAYAPQGAGLMCAVVCLAEGNDVCGWWIGSEGGEYPPSYFLLDGFYSGDEPRFYATSGGDLYGGWRLDYGKPCPELPEPVAVPDALCHRLEHLQFAFAREWLFFADDKDAETANEIAAYEKQGLPVLPVNIQHRRLGKLSQHGPVWTYASPGLDMNVIEHLRRHWPLDYRLD
ncbi:MAG: hypothetical protein C0522_02135 [Rhodocyclaceae bacterium]|jgi:hypothetical protein|nr:hypothetical protein [Rhodocyclaceae bacterium]